MGMDLNPRMNSRPSLQNERFHVIVIGGGINGVAIARECARAGRRTLLVEQHDFAAGTTSRSTRITAESSANAASAKASPAATMGSRARMTALAAVFSGTMASVVASPLPMSSAKAF